ncbi:MAG: hypothetical protein HOV77_16740 [Hamadaea sp.]|uniref:hypothetical protein n=1 Tax=Hamadaea sp. TaxID=2024425 RepID=UPI0017F45DCC|nr:hypothetical protein [Hamadaea sp.]NUT20829.1 hypothetical protein [Hamadaea sp.]
MSSPESQLTASLAAMRHDAVEWRDMAAAFRSAGQVAERLDLGELQLSFIADKLGMVELYRSVQDRMIALIGEAVQSHELMAASLETAADGYAADDAAALHRMQGTQ